MTVELAPGVTILTGRNATNRTSFLQTIMAAIGSGNVSLKGDADEGSVELEPGATAYRRTLRRNDGAVALGGEPYLDDPTADLFAFLLESSEAIDAERLADLIVYSSEYTQFLVAALLPEDARAVPDEYSRVTDIQYPRPH